MWDSKVFVGLLQALLIERSLFQWQLYILVAMLEIKREGDRRCSQFVWGHDGMAWCLEPVTTQSNPSWRAIISQSEGLRLDAAPQSVLLDSWCRVGSKRSEVTVCLKTLFSWMFAKPSPPQQLLFNNQCLENVTGNDQPVTYYRMFMGHSI